MYVCDARFYCSDNGCASSLSLSLDLSLRAPTECPIQQQSAVTDTEQVSI